MSLNSLQEYNGSNKDAMIPWLDHIKMVMDRYGIVPLEVGISKLKGLALGDINATHKEGNLMWYSFRQRLIEQCSNVPYASDAMFMYSDLLQVDEEPTTWFLARAKILLECIHHTAQLSSIPGVGWDNLYLVRGLKELCIRRREAREQDFWRMNEDVFDTMSCIATTEERNKIYFEQNFKSVSKELVQEVSAGKYTGQNPTSKTYNGPQHRQQTNSSFRSSSR